MKGTSAVLVNGRRPPNLRSALVLLFHALATLATVGCHAIVAPQRLSVAEAQAILRASLPAQVQIYEDHLLWSHKVQLETPVADRYLSPGTSGWNMTAASRVRTVETRIDFSDIGDFCIDYPLFNVVVAPLTGFLLGPLYFDIRYTGQRNPLIEHIEELHQLGMCRRNILPIWLTGAPLWSETDAERLCEALMVIKVQQIQKTEQPQGRIEIPSGDP